MKNNNQKKQEETEVTPKVRFEITRRIDAEDKKTVVLRTNLGFGSVEIENHDELLHIKNSLINICEEGFFVPKTKSKKDVPEKIIPIQHYQFSAYSDALSMIEKMTEGGWQIYEMHVPMWITKWFGAKIAISFHKPKISLEK